MGSLMDLNVYKQAREFRKTVSELVKSFPKEEKYRLVDQMIRSSRSCAANIAEGYGRFHFQETIQFCRQARGSYFETMEHTCCALDEKFIDEVNYRKINEQIEICLKTLNGYIDYLDTQKQILNTTLSS